MSLVDVILTRRSIRRYVKKKVPIEVLNKILEAGRQAPSAGNKQPWHFVVLDSDEMKEKVSRASEPFIRDSAFTIVGCGSVADVYSRKWSAIDTTMSLQNMVIAAWSLGIGSCWIGAFREEELRRLLSIPEDWKVIALISFGYPAEEPGTKWKKPLTEIVSYSTF